MAHHVEFPTVFVLPTRLDPHELHELEEQVSTVTHDPNEAEVIVGNLSQPSRAMFELRRHGVATEGFVTQGAANKELGSRGGPASATPQPQSQRSQETVRVVRLDWLTDSLKQGQALPADDYVIVEARKTAPRPLEQVVALSSIISTPVSPPVNKQSAPGRVRRREATFQKRPPLLPQSTSEDASLPPVPDYLQRPYSCERPTPANPPNAAFVQELKKIRKARTLNGDSIGVRAYSTSIASLAAYPFLLQTGLEVARLPGCGQRIAELYREWKDTGTVKDAEEVDSDPRLSVLALFYDIWGVGDVTARDFYNKGWRDLDDVVQHGWNSLTRVQQIGLKYYDEFLVQIPRSEVESIADIILDRVRRVDEGFQMVVVGGYRRGKSGSGDVDVVLSHPDESMTKFVINQIVDVLEKEGFITHTLSLSTRNSERGQETLQWKGNTSSGTGFDTLDKALVVWQSPTSPEIDDGGLAQGGRGLHRRVDIIVSPWRTVGCAIVGWSGGNTFERDLRRYCKKEKRLKFDSSGVRSRVDGSWVDLEGGALGKAPDMETAERRVFSGLGLEWRPPEERCTG